METLHHYLAYSHAKSVPSFLQNKNTSHFFSELVFRCWSTSIPDQSFPPLLLQISYSVPTCFHPELIVPSARDVKGQHLFSFEAVSGLARFEPCSALLSSLVQPPALLSRPESKNKYLSSRLYKLQAKISGHAVASHDYVF